MKSLAYRLVESFPEPGFSELQRAVFAGLEQQSQQLTAVLNTEAAARAAASATDHSRSLRIGVYEQGKLVAWTCGWPQSQSAFYMSHSGVVPEARRRGIYSELVRLVVEHARQHAFATVTSRHITSNNAVLIAKLRLGFQVSGFSYSEVYGPLIHLKYILGDLRRELYAARSAPLRSAEGT